MNCRRGRISLPAAAALGMVGVTAVLPSCGSACAGHPAQPASADGGLDAIVDHAVDVVPDYTVPPDADATPCPDPTTSLPPDIPTGWVRPPCAPIDCDVFISPDAAHARPASPWTSCGDGCLELVHDWADPGHRFFAPHGASKGGVRYIGYTRDLNGSLELQIVKLPENAVTFNAYMPNGLYSSKCMMYLHALSTEAGLLHHYIFGGSDPAKDRRLAYTLKSGDAIPELSLQNNDNEVPLEAVITAELWALTYSTYSILWHRPEPSNDMKVGWVSPDGRFLTGMNAVGSTILFSAFHFTGPFELFAWDPTGGSRTLVAFPSVNSGAAGGLFTDGVDLVWLQGSGFMPATQTFQQVHMMTSPYAAYATDLKPRELRASRQNLLKGTAGVVGGGYALYSEAESLGPQNIKHHHIVTRLSDGAFWELSPRPGFRWGWPLYIDAEELALVEDALGDVFVDAGLQTGESWTIVRRTIASLGAPVMPDAGP